jgi:hypothetical protein
MKIDMVYLWVDGSDESWSAKKNAELKKIGELPDTIAGKQRYYDNDELLFSLRSVERFAPWINHIFIVTDNQIPKWLDTNNPKITIIDHKEIMPEDALPCFNSNVIDFFIPYISSLSEHFIYANDDTLFMAKTKPNYFFTKKGIPIVRVIKEKEIVRQLKDLFPIGDHFRTLWENSDVYNCTKLNSRKLAYDIIGSNTCLWQESHAIDPYRKSDMLSVLNIPLIQRALQDMTKNRFRDKSDLQRILFHIFGVAKFGYNTVGSDFWTRVKQILTFKFSFSDKPVLVSDARRLANHTFRRKLVCINDPENNPGNMEIRKSNRDYLSKMFPYKSEFEK